MSRRPNPITATKQIIQRRHTHTAETEPRRVQVNNPRLLSVERMSQCEAFRSPHSSIADYAILSHTWRKHSDEILYQDIAPDWNSSIEAHPAFAKIDYTRMQAKDDGIQHFWIDTCCIDKSSSAELSEAINSMYGWYAGARVCYVYLDDVHKTEGDMSFRKSRWFTRAWTLQELLASRDVRFFDKEWVPLGQLSDVECAEIVSSITGINVDLLLHKVDLQEFSIAQRMSWAAHRRATRLEDRAYSLLGIFGINMPLLYGEGIKAYIRLQEEIIKTSSDLSILCWENSPECMERAGLNEHRTLLATSPSLFANSGDAIPLPQTFPRSYQMTNRGLEVTLPVRSYSFGSDGEKLTMASLSCTRQESLSDENKVLALNLQQSYDMDFNKTDVFKPWLRPWQRRRREAWDSIMGRHFDWHDQGPHARRGFVVGHNHSGPRLSLTTFRRNDFREQTIIVLRSMPSKPLWPTHTDSITANPVSGFNEISLAAGFLLSVLVIVITVCIYYAFHQLERVLDASAEPLALAGESDEAAVWSTMRFVWGAFIGSHIAIFVIGHMHYLKRWL